jgi:hypothetical protein
MELDYIMYHKVLRKLDASINEKIPNLIQFVVKFGLAQKKKIINI